MLSTILLAVCAADRNAAQTVNDFALTLSPGNALALSPDGCLVDDRISSVALHFCLKGQEFDFNLARAPSVFDRDAFVHAGRTISEEGLHEPDIFAYSSPDGDSQAVITFDCIHSSGRVSGLVRWGLQTIELDMATADSVQTDMQSFGANAIAVSEAVRSIFPEPEHQYQFLLRNLTHARKKSPDGADWHRSDVQDYIELESSNDPRRRLRGGRASRELVERWTNCYDQDHITRRLTVGIAVGTSLFKNRYNSDLQTALSAIADLFAKTNLVYKAQLNVVLSVGRVYVAALEDGGPGSQSWDQVSACDAHSASISRQLNGFNAWLPGGSRGDSAHGLWHLLDDCFDQRRGTVGLAYVGTVCNTRSRANSGVSWYSSSFWLTFAHEVGHNFGAGHSFEEGQGRTGGIMDYGDGLLGGEYQFNSRYRRAEMCGTIARVVGSCPAMVALDGDGDDGDQDDPLGDPTPSPTPITATPTPFPTRAPTRFPTRAPTRFPTRAPTLLPTATRPAPATPTPATPAPATPAPATSAPTFVPTSTPPTLSPAPCSFWDQFWGRCDTPGPSPSPTPSDGDTPELYRLVAKHRKCRWGSSNRVFKTRRGEKLTLMQCYERCVAHAMEQEQNGDAQGDCKHFAFGTQGTRHAGVCMGCKEAEWQFHYGFNAYDVAAFDVDDDP